MAAFISLILILLIAALAVVALVKVKQEIVGCIIKNGVLF